MQEIAAGTFKKYKSALKWSAVLALIYLLLVAVSIIGDGFEIATGGAAARLFAFATNPIIALMIGVVATAAIQSSSTVSSIIVGLVAGGLPLTMAIPMVMGANIGTSLTSTIVSLGHVRDGEEFKRAFSAATVHDSFNLFAVFLILPIELIFHPLENLSLWLAGFMAGDAAVTGVEVSSFNFVSFALAPIVDLILWSSSVIQGTWQGIFLIFLGVALILFVVHSIGKILKMLMTGRALEIMNTSVGRGPISGIGAGTLITVLVQSSSTTTSLIVPMAGSGVMSMKQVYPFTLGGNIGTTVTALLAATAITGATALLAFQIALIHFLFNVFAIILIFSIPVLRNVPPAIAEKMAEMTQKRAWFVGAYIVTVFFFIPLLVLGISELLL
ncbi:sodium:phosphate symporter [Rhodohalobacter mucosus]|uniref:Sodium:phosphate symporter n=1 Tax=Rhodohalobacter mucosus TaxID=2079485 RepID=A0A316TQD3_9BACT|nr:sodium:phosphate symporter [Rhodohalobacter mucosus]PWN06008.1 sodium:phosphate symporter [Rhodohalobacter mucosus]